MEQGNLPNHSGPFLKRKRTPVPITHDPKELFLLFLDDDVVDLIDRETNMYAEQCLAETGGTWSTTAVEIRECIGFHILMGINRIPEMRDYWAKDEKLHYLPIASQISRSQFEAITRHLPAFCRQQEATIKGREPGYNRLQKVQPIITAAKQHCTSIYRPNAQNSIDEATVLFKGMCIVSLR